MHNKTSQVVSKSKYRDEKSYMSSTYIIKKGDSVTKKSVGRVSKDGIQKLGFQISHRKGV